jgi:hypothetical protein
MHLKIKIKKNCLKQKQRPSSKQALHRARVRVDVDVEESWAGGKAGNSGPGRNGQ